MPKVSRFGRNKPLPRRPPEIPPQEQMQAALKDIRESETLRFGEAVQVSADIKVFMVYCVAWVAVACGIIALFLFLK